MGNEEFYMKKIVYCIFVILVSCYDPPGQKIIICNETNTIIEIEYILLGKKTSMIIVPEEKFDTGIRLYMSKNINQADIQKIKKRFKIFNVYDYKTKQIIYTIDNINIKNVSFENDKQFGRCTMYHIY